MELILVRHGRPADEAQGRCYGRLDVELSELGLREAERLATQLAAERLTRVVSSPRLRAVDTAAPIAAAHGLDVEVVEALRELDFGELEGCTYDEVAATRPELYARWMSEPTAVHFPGGECYADLCARVGDAVRTLRGETTPGAAVVAVTHGGVVRAALAGVLELPAARVFRLAVDYASVTRITWLGDEPVVRSVNQVIAPLVGGAPRRPEP